MGPVRFQKKNRTVRNEKQKEPKEEMKMMNNIMIHNMANMMAEETGLFELRNPEISGMYAKGWISRLISLIRRH